MKKAPWDKWPEFLYQCDGFSAIKHRSKVTGETRCGMKPTNKQYGSGAISYDHDCRSLQYNCQICLPEGELEKHS